MKLKKQTYSQDELIAVGKCPICIYCGYNITAPVYSKEIKDIQNPKHWKCLSCEADMRFYN